NNSITSLTIVPSHAPIFSPGWTELKMALQNDFLSVVRGEAELSQQHVGRFPRPLNLDSDDEFYGQTNGVNADGIPVDPVKAAQKKKSSKSTGIIRGITRRFAHKSNDTMKVIPITHNANKTTRSNLSVHRYHPHGHTTTLQEQLKHMSLDPQ